MTQSTKEEFGYIYNFENLVEDDDEWARKESPIEWRRKLWQFLSMRNNFELTNLDLHEDQEDKSEILEDSKVDKNKKTSEQIGEQLEKAVLKLFQHFLELCEHDNTFTITNARQQGRGQQNGHDLKFVCCEITGNRNIRFLIECKNYSKKIKLDNIAGKLAAAEAYHRDIHIDHWILISPNANVSNELEKLLELWEKVGEYPFKVQAWTPATRVEEFFGLIPNIYDEIIKVPDLEIHPKYWSEKKRQEVIEFWKQKLEPPLRLPQGWEQYLRNPKKLVLEPKEEEFEDRYDNNDYVDMNCKDQTGAAFAQTMEEKIYEWLEEPVSESPTLFLLGEFGDGKTFFTYVLSRKLVEKFRESPKNGWILVRIALKNVAKGFDPAKIPKTSRISYNTV